MHGIHVPSIRCATLSSGNFNRNKNTPVKRMRFLSLIHRSRSHRGHMLKTIVIYVNRDVNPCITPSYIQPGYRGGVMHVIHGGNRILNPVQHDPSPIFLGAQPLAHNQHSTQQQATGTKYKVHGYIVPGTVCNE